MAFAHIPVYMFDTFIKMQQHRKKERSTQPGKETSAKSDGLGGSVGAEVEKSLPVAEAQSVMPYFGRR